MTYIDDILIFSPNPRAALRQHKTLESQALKCGLAFHPHGAKVEDPQALFPEAQTQPQQIRYLGYFFSPTDFRSAKHFSDCQKLEIGLMHQGPIGTLALASHGLYGWACSGPRPSSSVPPSTSVAPSSTHSRWSRSFLKSSLQLPVSPQLHAYLITGCRPSESTWPHRR